jgi:hypothetical protein
MPAALGTAYLTSSGQIAEEVEQMISRGWTDPGIAAGVEEWRQGRESDPTPGDRTAKNPRGAQASGALGCLAAPLLIWLFAVALPSDPTVLKLVLLGIALSLGGWGAFRTFHPSKRALRRRSELPPIPEGATLLQRLRFVQEVVRADALIIADERMAPVRAQAEKRPYHVARNFGGRLTVTPPSPLPGDGLSFGLASLRRKRESWAFFPPLSILVGSCIQPDHGD